MGSMFRGDLMTLCDVYLQPEIAFDVLSSLGESGCVEVIDMHPELQIFQRSFIQELCRCSEMERKLRFMEAEMKLHNINIIGTNADSKAAPVHELVAFEAVVEKWERDLEQIDDNEQRLMKNYLELTEVLYMLKYIGPLLGQAEISIKPQKEKKATAKIDVPGDQNVETGHLFVVTGVVNRLNAFSFETLLWRMSRGMIHYRRAKEDATLIDPKTYHEIRKVAFLAIFQGQQLAKRVQKVCVGYKVNTYPCPSTYTERMEMTSRLSTRLTDLEEVLSQSRYLRCKALRTISKQWVGWLTTVRKSKAIYHNMNNFNLDISNKVLIGRFWVPNPDLDYVKNTIAECCVAHQTNVESFISPVTEHNLDSPTLHRTNKFTHGFQVLINAYGDAKYGELNPGLYTIITFPFLFGIMFGDVGHGFLLFLFALWMLKNEAEFLEDTSDNEIWNIIFGGRYIILLMGAFSMFTGTCYNDVFGVPLALFGSSYFRNHYSVEELRRDETLDIDPRRETANVYSIGFDPIWGLAKNSIMIENSLKMKLSIIIGVIHMIFGVILSTVNYRYFKRKYSFYLQFVPEFIFLVFLFFWLVIMIYYKWILYSAKREDPELNTACAPQILILFIDMALMSESKPVDENCMKAYMFDGQRSFQTFLLLVALLMVPILLFGSPLYKMRKNQARKKKAMEKLEEHKALEIHDLTQEQYEKRLKELTDEVENCTISFAELMIYQGVHTIEYVLSTISHTASYLRLWALSLAHAQLSHMLFHMVMAKLALKTHSKIGAIKIFIIFAIWAVFSVAILVVMEGLSAFLHTLRLHWVEFMSKFFTGGGTPFRPFSFKTILASSDSDATTAGCKKMMQSH